MISLLVDGVNYIEWINYPDGTKNCIINEDIIEHEFAMIKVDYLKDYSADILDIALTVDAIKETYRSNLKDIPSISLYFSYLPNARADRKFVKGNPTSPVDIYLDLVFKMHNWYAVFVEDIHSIRNFPITNIPQSVILERTMGELIKQVDYVVAPDAGATERASHVLSHLPHLQGIKNRDLATGKILKIGLDDCSSAHDLTDSICLITDDICDGGGTFIPIAKELKELGAKEVWLFVTHGIFSKGKDTLLENGIDRIFCSNESQTEKE